MMLTKLSFYEKEIGLEWKVIYHLEKRLDCKTISFPKKKKHKIFLPRFITFDEFNFFLPDILHQLCRCKLAEKIDPFLFQPIFSKDCFSKKERKFLFPITQCISKFWANELCHQHFPEIIALDHQNFFEIFQELLKKSELFSDQLFFLEGILSLSLKMAEEKRYQLKPSVKPLLKALPDQQNLILKISEFLSSLPSLSYEKEKDLKLFEKSTQKLCEIFEFPISPYIEENGGLVWKMKQ